MYSDEIIIEVWRNRDAYVARHHYDMDEILADLRERQKRPDCKLVDRRREHVRRLPPTFADIKCA
jgi:hypothetical protein